MFYHSRYNTTGLIINILVLHHILFSLCEFPLTDSIYFLFASPRWMPVVCWRRGWTLPSCLTALQKHFPTHPSTRKPSCSRVQLYQPTMFWQEPASSTNTLASSSLCRLAPSTWSTGSSISPRTRWRCPGKQMARLLQKNPPHWFNTFCSCFYSN